jgi:hypothetical protein
MLGSISHSREVLTAIAIDTDNGTLASALIQTLDPTPYVDCILADIDACEERMERKARRAMRRENARKARQAIEGIDLDMVDADTETLKALDDSDTATILETLDAMGEAEESC